ACHVLAEHGQGRRHRRPTRRSNQKKSRRSQMISAAENELLTRVGRNTPMGKFMRQFWIPACLSLDIPADGPQRSLMLLGEKLIAFRDTAGRGGLFDPFCPHR